ncbi:site-specific integrase [Pseudoflavonifractor sp. An44]|uniref:tyrosine-type recombinase/integrase n=1 Tax=Pseudoflavonifractor sp. An44 TaxID=1965635 RepID=UPI000B392A84|nr:tyrosine-type recombinase/integrase [Pseudoflavonifractor sp. An44]OUN92649.1 site-specific integrase [Pseudoflavonifractor sp. An44]
MAEKRKKGEGTVRLRKDGRWEGRVVVGYDEEGNPKTKNVLAKTKKECVDKLKELKSQCGVVRPVQVQSDMLFRDWLDYWYQNHAKPKLRQTTQQGYEYCIVHHLVPGVGDIPLNQLTQADLQQFFRRMKESGRKANVEQHGAGVADRTVRNCHAVCQMALEKAVEEKLIHTNPAVGCKLPPLKGKEMKILSQEEIQRFLIQAKAEGMYELFLLELTTGMRRGELLALRWDDLDFTTGKLRIDKQVCPVGGKLVISEPKTKAANRTIILPAAMVDLLAEYKKGVFSDLMFPSRTKPDQPIDPGYVRKRLQAILKRAGCKKVRFHDLRHTFATLSLENGMDVKTLSTIIGHVSSETTLNTYTHITDEMRRKAALSIDQGIAKAEVQPLPEEEHKEPKREVFTPVQPTRRRPGTGSVSQINDHLWEGRYSPVWPDGKKRPRNVYAPTQEECEEKLAELIRDMNREIAALRSGASVEYPDGVNPKKKAIAAYLRENPGVTNKSQIARELHMSRPTVQQYYDEVRAEFRKQV